MVNVKEAVTSAMQNFKSWMGEALSDVVLEEVELSDDERFWLITLSGLLPAPPLDPMLSGTVWSYTTGLADALKRRRVYKIFTVNTDTGNVKSMKIRHLPS